MIEVFLPRPKSVNSLYGQRGGQQRYKTKAYKAYSLDCALMIAQQRPGCVDGPYWLEITLRRFGNSGDLGNYEKGISDALVENSVLSDDIHARGILMTWGEPGSEQVCRCRIYDEPPAWARERGSA